MPHPSVTSITSARIPTVVGEFQLYYYDNSVDEKEHLALVLGDVEAPDEVLVRVHSECFTGDVIGSLRCDCGEQLNRSMRLIAEQGAGVILYLRQEGRGIGLEHKLQAYNLQDQGYDTVEANLELGHGADERDYSVGALMLQDLGVEAVRLLTNNPAKIEHLEALGIHVSERVPLNPHINEENAGYLRTKVERMRHLLNLNGPAGRFANGHSDSTDAFDERAQAHFESTGLPYVTLSYAQTLDGSIAAAPGQHTCISGNASARFTHELRAQHDAILVGINTVLSDDPRLTVRHVEGAHPQPVILDTHLRFPLDATLLSGPGPGPLIATGPDPSASHRKALEAAGAEVVVCGDAAGQRIDLPRLLRTLGERGIHSLMVEGGSSVITSFLVDRCVDHVALTISPQFMGGLHAVAAPGAPSGDGAPPARASDALPRLENRRQRWLGDDLILRGDPVWEAPA